MSEPAIPMGHGPRGLTTPAVVPDAIVDENGIYRHRHAADDYEGIAERLKPTRLQRMDHRMSGMIAGFLRGMTFYPFPCLVWEPFDSWSDRKLRAYVAGVFTTAAVPVVLLLVSL